MSLFDFGKSEEQTQGFIYTEEQLMARRSEEHTSELQSH